VEEDLLKELQCPVCTEYMIPPIMLCANGHNICYNCKPKVAQCPSCREQFMNTRNVALEKMAKKVIYPCTYRKYGCMEVYNLAMIGEHQVSCRHRPQTCLVQKLNLGTCTWTGITSEMRKHLKQTHMNVCIDYNGNTVLRISGVTPATKHCKLIFAYNAVFYSCCEIQNGIFYAVVQYVGPADVGAKYRYQVEFFNKDRTESLAVSHLARTWLKDLNEVHSSGDCVKLYPEHFNRFRNEKNELIFLMEISTTGSNYCNQH
jgi:E3 ubiquitin-protein ligase SIAH1